MKATPVNIVPIPEGDQLLRIAGQSIYYAPTGRPQVRVMFEHVESGDFIQQNYDLERGGRYLANLTDAAGLGADAAFSIDWGEPEADEIVDRMVFARISHRVRTDGTGFLDAQVGMLSPAPVLPSGEPTPEPVASSGRTKNA